MLFSVQPVKSTFTQLADAFSNAHIYSANETTPGAWTSDVSSPGIAGLSGARSACATGPKRQKTLPASSTTSTTAAELPSLNSGTPSKLSKWITDVNSLDVATDEAETEQKPLVLPTKAKRQRKRKRKQAQPPDMKRSDSVDSLIKTEEAQHSKPTVVFRAESSNRMAGHIR